MKKTLFLILVLVSIIVLLFKFLTLPTMNLFGLQEQAGLKVLSSPSGAQIFIDDLASGQTPYENKNLSPKEYMIKVVSDQRVWEGRTKLTTGTLTVIGRDLSDDKLSSAGEILSLEPGNGVIVLSNPVGAIVEIDGKKIGQTPIGLNIDPGEHFFTFIYPGFLTRNIKAAAQEGFRLIVNVDLAVVEKKQEQTPSLEIKSVPKVVVLSTSTGFLRVREKPSLASSEIARVTPGDELELLEETVSWMKIKLESGNEGYVSASFVKKL